MRPCFTMLICHGHECGRVSSQRPQSGSTRAPPPCAARPDVSPAPQTSTRTAADHHRSGSNQNPGWFMKFSGILQETLQSILHQVFFGGSHAQSLSPKHNAPARVHQFLVPGYLQQACREAHNGTNRPPRCPAIDPFPRSSLSPSRYPAKPHHGPPSNQPIPVAHHRLAISPFHCADMDHAHKQRA